MRNLIIFSSMDEEMKRFLNQTWDIKKLIEISLVQSQKKVPSVVPSSQQFFLQVFSFFSTDSPIVTV